MSRLADLFDYAERYPATPGHYGSDTSRAAAEKIAPKAPNLRERCLQALREQGPATADELAARVGKDEFSIRPRVTELKKLGAIEDSGERRENESGCSAKVWRAR